jgi:hypothetical protein
MTRLASTHELRGPTGLDEDARRVILRALADAQVAHARLVSGLMRAGTYSGIRDYLRAVEEVHGTAVGMGVIEAMRAATSEQEDILAIDWQGEQARAAQTGMPLGLLLAMPTADFLTAVELGIAAAPDPSARAGSLASEINRICEARGIHYRLEGFPPAFKWTGDVEIQKNVLAPALSALDDPRLRDGPKVEFDSARRELRTNTRESRKQAATEACNSVESMMQIVCAERGVAVTSNATAQPLFNALVSAGVVPKENEAMVLGPSRFGNKRGRHGAGPVAHDVTEAEAEQVVAAAAVAIVYLGKQLP